MKRTFIARADDFGSAQAANAAILEALTQGCLIRNVSCMAPGPHIARDAEALRAFAARVDLGLHLTVNSEWDTVAWTPCGPPAAVFIRPAKPWPPPRRRWRRCSGRRRPSWTG